MVNIADCNLVNSLLIDLGKNDSDMYVVSIVFIQDILCW